MSEQQTIKLRVGRVVANGRVTVAGNRMVTRYPFVEALRKLTEDPMGVRLRYTAGRTLDEAARIAEAYEKRRNELIEKHGRKRSERLAADIEAALAVGVVGEAANKRLATMRAELAAIGDNPALDQHMVCNDDAAAVAALTKALQEAEAEEIDLSYQRAMITLADGEAGQSKLSGEEMVLLDGLVELPS